MKRNIIGRVVKIILGVVAFDDRGHELNPDDKVTFGIHELRDCR